MTIYYEGTSENESGEALWLDVIRKVNSLSDSTVFGQPVIIPANGVTPYTEVYCGLDERSPGGVAHAIVTIVDETVNGQPGQRVRVVSLNDKVDAFMTQALTDLVLPLERSTT